MTIELCVLDARKLLDQAIQELNRQDGIKADAPTITTKLNQVRDHITQIVQSTTLLSNTDAQKPPKPTFRHQVVGA